MIRLDLTPSTLDTLSDIHARAVELTGIAHGLDLLAVDALDSKGLRMAFSTLSRLLLERCTEVEGALDRLSTREHREND